jgi:threonine dehydratase
VPTTRFLPRSAAPDKIVKFARLGRQGGDFRRGLGRQQSGGLAIRRGGLISGIAIAAKALRPGIQIIGVEPVGAPTLHDSLAAGHLVELTRLDTAAVTLASRRSEPLNLTVIQQTVERMVLVSDQEMREAARWLWSEAGVAAELSGAAAVAALHAGPYRPLAGERVCAVACGAGTCGFERG